MVTITLMGQLQTADGERDFACSLPESLTVRQLIQRQGQALRPVLQLLRKKSHGHREQADCERGYAGARRRCD